MRRLRFAMLALALALSIPVALLIALALQSVAFEEANRHRTLAARTFDEMERALSRFLEEEEARPIEHYAYFLDAAESDRYGRSDRPGKPDRRVRSPLSQLSDRPFLIGYFQIDPQGSLYTPLRPRPGSASPEPLSARTLAAIASLERLVPPALPGARAKRVQEKSRAGSGLVGSLGESDSAPRASGFGSTITLEQPATPASRLASRLGGLGGMLKTDAKRMVAPAESLRVDDQSAGSELAMAQVGETAPDRDSLSLDEALESLNVGQKLRESRVQKRSRDAVYADSKRSLGELATDRAVPLQDRVRSRRAAYASAAGAKDGRAGESSAHDALPEAERESKMQANEGLASRSFRQRSQPERQSQAERQSEPEPVPAFAAESLIAAAHQPSSAFQEERANWWMREKEKALEVAEVEGPASEGLPVVAPEALHSVPALLPVRPTSLGTTPKQLAMREVRERIEIDPMVGHVAQDGHLLLSRTVLVGERGYRQGLLIDRAKLGQWLNDEVIAGSRLADVSELRFAGEVGTDGGPDLDRASDTPADRGYSYRYRHHFAEPFESLSATLALKPLAGVASARNIYALSGLLAVVAAGGLFAVYRMIAVVVRFAERRSAFVAAVSHELKTPLTAIRMYGEMLRDGLVSSEEKRQEYYRTIHDESERLGRLINNVLEFSQLERGQRELNLVVGSVGEVVREVVSNLAPHAERQGFTLSARVDDDLPSVRFDRDALVQVIFNLADNAMKYGRGAGPQRVEIGCHRADERGARTPEGHRVMLEVRDFGPGVPRRHLSHLFEPFYRVAASNEVAKGTGIGLALVRDLCEAMGAGVTAHNVDEGGFRIQVDFRVAEA